MAEFYCQEKPKTHGKSKIKVLNKITKLLKLR